VKKVITSRTTGLFATKMNQTALQQHRIRGLYNKFKISTNNPSLRVLQDRMTNVHTDLHRTKDLKIQWEASMKLEILQCLWLAVTVLQRIPMYKIMKTSKMAI
jgi:hypothetical protein